MYPKIITWRVGQLANKSFLIPAERKFKYSTSFKSFAYDLKTFLGTVSCGVPSGTTS